MSTQRIKDLNQQLDALQKQRDILAQERASASEYERSQIKAQTESLNSQCIPLEREKQRLKKTLLQDAEKAVDDARAMVHSLADRSSPASNAQKVIDSIMQSVDYHASELKSKVIAELNGTADARDRATVNFSSPGFLAFALRDAIETRLRLVADEWLVKQNATTPGELEQARNALIRAISRRSQIEAL